jgi:hypothetical protein
MAAHVTPRQRLDQCVSVCGRHTGRHREIPAELDELIDL